jgi:hypothetical protein
VDSGLVLERFFKDKSAPTLLTIGGPASPPSEYLSTDDLVRGYPNPVTRVSEASQAIDDALTPRVADW